VETGVSNGTLTEITSGIKAGTQVVEEMVFDMPETADAQQKSNPFMPGPRNRNNNQKSGTNAKK